MGQVSRLWKDLNMDEKQVYADENMETQNFSSVKESSITEYKAPNAERSPLGVLQLFQDNRSLSLSVSQNTNTTSSITKQQKFQFAMNQQAIEAMKARNETVRAETEALNARNESKRIDFFAKFLGDD